MHGSKGLNMDAVVEHLCYEIGIGIGKDLLFY
jgi:hypothetical protein